MENTITDNLATTSTFEEFLAKYFETLERDAECVCNYISKSNETKSRFYPQLVRTLLVDDCIDTGREFWSGGPRYNLDIIDFEGFSNAVDSLVVLKQLVFEEKLITGERFQQVLAANFDTSQDLVSRINRLPKYGQGNAQVDALASRVATFAFDQFKKRCGWGGRKFLASCLMFATYADRGKIVGATPDGRLAGQALSDSLAAVQGMAKRGPTAMLETVEKFDLSRAIGAVVVNVTLPIGRADEKVAVAVKDMINAHFSRGGFELQFNVMSKERLEEARKDPDSHRDLLVRVGGYSDYFVNLSEELQDEILRRFE